METIKNEAATPVNAIENPTVLPAGTVVRTKFASVKADFMELARPLVFRSEDGKTTLVLTPKEFSTGSWGYNFNGKVYIDIPGLGGTVLQAGINAPVAGSKPK